MLCLFQILQNIQRLFFRLIGVKAYPLLFKAIDYDALEPLEPCIARQCFHRGNRPVGRIGKSKRPFAPFERLTDRLELFSLGRRIAEII